MLVFANVVPTEWLSAKFVRFEASDAGKQSFCGVKESSLVGEEEEEEEEEEACIWSGGGVFFYKGLEA
jgi:hypothetical protein